MTVAERVLFSDWVSYWKAFRYWIKVPTICSGCNESIELDTPALKKGNKLFCTKCTDKAYKEVRNRLGKFEKAVRAEARELGHKLTAFKPGYWSDKNHSVLIAECKYCRTTVCYEVVDFIHINVVEGERPVVIEKPTGFPLKRKCPKWCHQRNLFF